MMPYKIAIMQPYIFPYIGYMNLVNAADVFVFYDDVNFIKSGWINRNRIVLNGAAYRFTIPLKELSANKYINETEAYDIKKFATKFLLQIKTSYRLAPYLDQTVKYLEDVLYSGEENIGDLSAHSVENFFSYIGVEKRFLKSSEAFPHTAGLGRAERLVEIVKELKSTSYVNIIGGAELYSKSKFENLGVKLNFVKPEIKEYRQINTAYYIPSLSIIDLMMNLSIKSLRDFLDSYELI
jgi:hypothetical protein